MTNALDMLFKVEEALNFAKGFRDQVIEKHHGQPLHDGPIEKALSLLPFIRAELIRMQMPVDVEKAARDMHEYQYDSPYEERFDFAKDELRDLAKACASAWQLKIKEDV